jgi:glycosyltransferase involved in cell wall biosynthesis
VVTVDDPSAAFLKEQGLVVHAMGLGSPVWAYSKHLLPWLKEHLETYDAVILHGMWQYPGHALRRAMQSIKKPPPYLLYPHGMLDPWFQRERSRRWKALRNRIYWRWAESKVVAEAAAILFTCEEEKRLASRTFSNYKPRREIVVGYGVPEPPSASIAQQAAFLAGCSGLTADQPFLLFLSRIDFKKGVGLLIKAYAVWAAREPKFPALVIAGPLESAYAKEMQNLAAQLIPARRASPPSGLRAGHDLPAVPSAQVFFPGMLQGDAKWGAFQSCSAYVLPSHQENFGIAVVEALACGKPVLISDKVNICREIESAGAGWVGQDSLEGVTGLLGKWWENRTDQPAPELVRRCYQQHFAVEGAAETLEEILAGLLQVRRGGFRADQSC